MEAIYSFFEKVVLPYLSVFFTVLNIYFTLNKLWSRKHHRAVAESISIGGRFIAIAAAFVITLNFYFNNNWNAVINMSMLVAAEFLQIFIGAGFWVESERKKGIFTLIRESLSMERKESGDLAKMLFKPSGADKIIGILRQVAMIDGELDVREREFIQQFADRWDIDISWKAFAKKQNVNNLSFSNLRDAMTEYLKDSPPPEQVLQLGDLLSMLVKIDDEVTEQEELMLAELTGLINLYAKDGAEKESFRVALIPQSYDQEKLVDREAPEGEKTSSAGGRMTVIGPYYSLKYAEIVCQKFRALDIMAFPASFDAQEDKYTFFNPDGI